jgi:phage-related protein
MSSLAANTVLFQVLNDTFKYMAGMTTKLVKINRPIVDEGIQLAHDKLKEFVDDKRPMPQGPSSPNSMLSTIGEAATWIFDNPVLKTLERFNPLSLLTESAGEAFFEEFPDALKIPNIWPLVQVLLKHVGNVLEKEFATLITLLEDFVSKVKDTLHDPSTALQNLKDFLGDCLWTLFDVIKNVITEIYDMIGDVLQPIFTLMTSEWKIPVLTSIYDFITGGHEVRMQAHLLIHVLILRSHLALSMQ